jgi:hypothetical protein
MVNYREVGLSVNGFEVKQLCVVGLAAERFWHEAFHQRRGLSSLRWSDVTSVDLLDVVRKDDAGRSRKHGRLQVDLTPADSQLALRVARAVAERLEEDFRILDAIVDQKDDRNISVGVHDLVCERREAPMGLTSVEVKLRRITSDGLMPKMRKQVQDQAWKLWPAARADKDTEWAERLCLVVRWGPSDPLALGGWKSMHAEVVSAGAASNAPVHWKPLWGWRGQAASPEARARAQAKAKALAKEQAKAKAQAKLRFERAYNKCRQAKQQRGKEMRSVSDLLNAVDSPKSKRVRPTINQKMPVWSRKFSWPPNSWARDPACGSRKGGGIPGYVASYAALNDIYDEVAG